MISQFLQGLSNIRVPFKKKPYPHEVGTPPIAPQQDFIFSAPSRVDTSGLEAERAGYLETLKKGAPKPVSAEVDPYEAFASLLAGQGVSDPGTLSRIQNTPYGLAQNRAGQANLAAMAQYEADQKEAQIGLQSADRMIGGAWDANTAADRIESIQKQAQMKGQIQQAIAQAKNDTTLITAAAKMGDKLTPGAALTIARQYLINTNPDIANDPQGLELAAQQMAQTLGNDPSFMGRLEQEKVRLKGEQQQNTQVEKLRKVAEDDDQVSPEGRYKAMFQLRSMGVPGYAELTIEELRQHAEALSPAGRAKEAQVKQLESRTNLIAAQIDLTKERAAKVAKETDLLDEKAALDVAKAHAYIENVNSLISSRSTAGQKDNTKALGEALKGLNNSESNLTKQLNALRVSLRAAYEAEDKERIDKTNAAIVQLKTQLKTIQTEKEKIAKALTPSVSAPMPKKGGNDYGPLQPNLSGPIGGKTKSGASFTYTPR